MHNIGYTYIHVILISIGNDHLCSGLHIYTQVSINNSTIVIKTKTILMKLKQTIFITHSQNLL